MKYVTTVLLCIVIFLAVSSGITKVMLMPQDVEFFGRYGLHGPGLIAFGAVQILAGLALISRRHRFLAAQVVSVTFAASALFLLLDGAIVMAGITLLVICILQYLAFSNRTAA